MAYHRNDNIRFRRDAKLPKVKSEQRRPKADSCMRSPPVHASNWKRIADTFRTSFQTRYRGAVVQWLERPTDNRVIAGSNPAEAVWKLWQFPLPHFASVFRKRH